MTARRVNWLAQQPAPRATRNAAQLIKLEVSRGGQADTLRRVGRRGRVRGADAP